MPRPIEYAPKKSGYKIEDIPLRMDQTFMRKPTIRAADIDLELNLEQTRERLKCQHDALYFAKNFYKITSLDKGFILFDMYEYQEGLFRAFQEDRFNVSLQSRQSGKCVHHDTKITVRKFLGEPVEMTIGEFHHKIAQAMEPIRVYNGSDGTRGQLSSYTDRKFVDSYAVFGYDVLTDKGWVPIKSSHITIDYDEVYVKTESGRTLKCADDHILFKNGASPIQKYAKNLKFGDRVVTENGPEVVIQVLNMKRKVQMYDLQVDSEDHRYYTDGFLSHNTTVVAAFLLWFAMFHPDTEIAILANKERQAKEILSRISKAYMDLPFFLQRGCKKFGSLEIEFDNGSKLAAYATSPDSIRGKSVKVLYVDEVAFIENDMEFWESTLPTVASSLESRVIMTSTPKGERGLFYKIWKEAEPDEKGHSNGFRRTKVTWRDVPTYASRPGWEESERKRIGDARFEQEYNCSFKGSSNTLIGSKYLEKMISKRPLDELSDYTKVFYPYDPNHRYIAVTDVGGGLGLDYSVLTIFDVTEYPFRIAAKYRNNEISPLLYPHTIIDMCEQYGNCPVLIETNNDVGGQAITVLWYELEYPEVIMTSTDQKRAGSGVRVGGRLGKPGIKTTSRVRNIGCSNLKVMIEREQLLIEDLDTIQELGTFIRKGERYEADAGCHDDCVMTLVLFCWLVKQEWFVDLYEKNVGSNLYKTASEKSIEEMLPFGGMNKNRARAQQQTTYMNTSRGSVKVRNGSAAGMEAWMKD